MNRPSGRGSAGSPGPRAAQRGEKARAVRVEEAQDARGVAGEDPLAAARQARAVTPAGWRTSSRRASPARAAPTSRGAGSRRGSPWRGSRRRREGERPHRLVVAQVGPAPPRPSPCPRGAPPRPRGRGEERAVGEKASESAAASWPVRRCRSVRSTLARFRERRSHNRMAPSAPATASRSVAGESAASLVAGGSPKVPTS